jgi:hypothetical protein
MQDAGGRTDADAPARPTTDCTAAKVRGREAPDLIPYTTLFSATNELHV